MSHKHRFTAGRANENGIAHFPARARVEHDSEPGHNLRSARIVLPPTPDDVTDVEFTEGGPTFSEKRGPNSAEDLSPALEQSIAQAEAKKLIRDEVKRIAWVCESDISPSTAQKITDGLMLAMQRIAQYERDKALVAVRQLTDVVHVLVAKLEQHHADNPKDAA